MSGKTVTQNREQVVYKNPWHKRGYNSPTFSTAAMPVQLGKYTRYQRIPGAYDFVFNGVCFAQRAGPANESQIDADLYAQTNLKLFCGVTFGLTWDDTQCLSCGKTVEPFTLDCDACVTA